MTSTSLSTADRPLARRGFTLLEMLIVLAILAAVAAWTWPSLRRQMISAELRDAGKQVRAELARARHRAVQTGTVQQFRFQPGKRGFEISPALCVPADGNAAEALTIDAAQVGSPLETTSEASRRPGADRHALPEGAFFLTAAAAEDPLLAGLDPGSNPAGATLDANGTRAFEATDAATIEADDIWSQPIVFYPNGRTTDARIRLANRSGAHLDVTLRGLTGVAKVGQLRRRKVR